MRFHKQRSRQRHPHPPPTAHVLRRPLHHLLAEPQTMQNTSRLCIKRVRVQLLQLLIRRVQRHLVHVVRHRQVLDAFFEFCDFFFGRGNDEVDGVDVGGLSFAADEVDVDVFGNFNIPLGDRLQEGGLGGA